jgi:hypothetical protein
MSASGFYVKWLFDFCIRPQQMTNSDTSSKIHAAVARLKANRATHSSTSQDEYDQLRARPPRLSGRLGRIGRTMPHQRNSNAA